MLLDDKDDLFVYEDGGLFEEFICLELFVVEFLDWFNDAPDKLKFKALPSISMKFLLILYNLKKKFLKKMYTFNLIFFITVREKKYVNENVFL